MHMQKNELVTIRTFTHNSEALILQSLLEEEGIYVFLKDKEVIASDPFLSNAVGGVKVQVKKEDVEKALPIKEKYENSLSLHKKGNLIKYKGRKFDRQFEECPKCGTEYIYVRRLTFVQELYKVFNKKEYLCVKCSHEWRMH